MGRSCSSRRLRCSLVYLEQSGDHGSKYQGLRSLSWGVWTCSSQPGNDNPAPQERPPQCGTACHSVSHTSAVWALLPLTPILVCATVKPTWRGIFPSLQVLCLDASSHSSPLSWVHCTTGCLCTAMGSGEVRPPPGHPASGVTCLHAPQAAPV